jgi:hypothetical protein
VGWAQSSRTGKWYLALATPTHSIQVDGRSHGTTGRHINKHVLHRCDEPTTGGFDACPLCGRHHNVYMTGATAEQCQRYPDAP